MKRDNNSFFMLKVGVLLMEDKRVMIDDLYRTLLVVFAMVLQAIEGEQSLHCSSFHQEGAMRQLCFEATRCSVFRLLAMHFSYRLSFSRQVEFVPRLA